MPARYETTTAVILCDSGAELAQSAIGTCTTTLSVGNLFGFSLGVFELSCTLKTTASCTPASRIDLYFTPSGPVADALAPDVRTTSYAQRYMGSFIPDAQTINVLTVEAPLIPVGKFKVLINNLSAVSLSAGWSLKVVPYSMTAA